MRIPRIYHPEALRSGATITLDSNAARHVGKVLRLGPGDELRLFDGSGGEYVAEIIVLAKRDVTVCCHEHLEDECESPLIITLAQGISKGERMDYTIQKAVELGISRIVPVATSRTVVNLKGERLEKRLAHWRGVIISACEQCGRNTLPELLPMQTFNQWLANPFEGKGVLLDHRASQGISDLELGSGTPCTILIGPEGGLSESERNVAYKNGYEGVRLGPRVLRTETAALTALAAIQSRWGDLG